MLITLFLCRRIYSKTDLLVRQRFQNPLPPPSFPPMLLTIKTDPSRYASYDFLVPLSLEREVPMIVDSEGGMHLDQNLVPGYWESTAQGRDGAMAPDLNIEADLEDEDLELLVDPPAVGAAANQGGAGIMPPNGGGANLDVIASGRAGGANGRSPASILDQRRKDVIWIKRSEYSIQSDANNALKKEAMVRE
jgi:RNA polymerase II-associated factor 1